MTLVQCLSECIYLQILVIRCTSYCKLPQSVIECVSVCVQGPLMDDYIKGVFPPYALCSHDRFCIQDPDQDKTVY